jgi:O-antigen/teichoic acid export membrane protein
MTLKKSLLGGACLSIQPLLLNILSLPALAYIIRGLGPTAYGQWTMAAALIGALGILTNLGLRGAFIRQAAADPQNAPSLLAEQLGLRLMLAAGATALAMSLCVALKYPAVVIACAAVAGAAMIVTTFASTLIDLLQALHRNTTVAAVNLVSGLVLTAASVVVIWLGMGPVALSLAYLTGPLTALFALPPMCPQKVRIHFGVRAAVRLLRTCRSFTAQQLLNTLPAYADALLLPRLIGATQFGFYTAGTLLPLRLTVVPDGLCTAAYPLMTQRFCESAAGGTRLAMRYLGICVGVCGLIAACVALLAGPISQVLFPRQPDSCRQVILVTIWALPLFGIETALGYAINAAGADAAQARASLPAALCNVALTIVLMSRLGIAGACIAIPLRHTVRIVMLSACFSRWNREQWRRENGRGVFILVPPASVAG